MAKRLFLSCYSKELSVALELKNNLEYAFKDKLYIESPLDDMKCGDAWKEYIKTRLSDCDGLITLITPAYAKRAWCTAEFIPFWMEEKKIFPVTVGFSDAASADIFKLITDDYQIARLETADDVEGLFERIAEFCEGAKPGLKYLNGIVDGCAREYRETVSKESKDGGLSAGQIIFYDSDVHISQYLFSSTIWECSLNPEDRGVLAATCLKEFEFVCDSNNLKYIELPFRALDDTGIAFELLEQRSDSRQVTFSPLSKREPSVYSYQIKFKPALKQNEIIRLKYKITVPFYKFATKEKAIEYIAKNGSERKEFGIETTSIRVTVPTDTLVYKIILAPECEANLLETQPKWIKSKSLAIEEFEYLRNNKDSYCERYDPQIGSIVELNRKNPTVGMTYYFSWELPNEADL